MLQTRNAKRPAQAAVRFAVDAVDEGLLTREEALMTIDPPALDALLHPSFDPKAQLDVLATGVAASPGAAKGEVVFTAPEAVAAAADGRDVILVRPFTDADDVAGFHAAKGILTSEGGKASHAALVARGMGRPAVVGVERAHDRRQGEDDQRSTATCHPRGRPDRDRRDKGCVTIEDVAARRGPGRRATSSTVLGVGRRDPPARCPRQRRHARRRRARARARRRGHRPVPDRAHVHGRGSPAEDARDDHGRHARGRRKAALAELLPLQQQDFEGMFEAMARPAGHDPAARPAAARVPARTSPDLAAQVERARVARASALIWPGARASLLARVEEITEANPMLGTRGCRLGILYPEIYEMQVQAILRAAKAASRSRRTPRS